MENRWIQSIAHAQIAHPRCNISTQERVLERRLNISARKEEFYVTVAPILGTNEKFQRAAAEKYHGGRPPQGIEEVLQRGPTQRLRPGTLRDDVALSVGLQERSNVHSLA